MSQDPFPHDPAPRPFAERPFPEDAPRSRLGRGLAALIGDSGDEGEALRRLGAARRVPLERLRPNPHNPRRHFAEADLADLAASLKEKGVLQPVLARPVPGERDALELIAGERRWRAAALAGLPDVPVIVIEVGDREALEIAIVENVQRADLDPMEEAAGYEALVRHHGYTQEALARVVGKSRPHVANALRLTKLPDAVKAHLREGRLSAGHARALMGAEKPEALAKAAVVQGLSVREVERRAKAPAPKRARKPKDADAAGVEQALSSLLGLAVSIKHAGPRGGALTVRYRSVAELERLCGLLRGR